MCSTLQRNIVTSQTVSVGFRALHVDHLCQGAVVVEDKVLFWLMLVIFFFMLQTLPIIIEKTRPSGISLVCC